MSDTTRHSAEDGFHEIQLTGKQLVFLFMATTVVAVVIFLCGVLVGRGVQSARPLDAAEAAAPPPAGEGLPAPAPQAGEPSPATAESLSYAQRLQGEEPREQLKSSPDSKSESTDEPPTPLEAVPEETARPQADGWVVQVAALRDRSAAVSIIKRLTSRGFPAFILEPAAGGPAPGYRVRVGPYPDRPEAERVARRLEREEQFKPFITR